MYQAPQRMVRTPSGYVPPHITARFSELCQQLRSFNGHRTVWLERRRGQLWHAEPDEEPPVDATYLGTYWRPTPADMIRGVLAHESVAVLQGTLPET